MDDPISLHHNQAFAASDSHLLPQLLIDLAHDISLLGGHRRIFKTERANLIRRVKLLQPLFEDVKEFKHTFPDQAVVGLSSLVRALQAARELLRFCDGASKIYLVLDRDVVTRFFSVEEELEHALDAVPFSLLDISDEVQEQVALVHTQLKRAKGRIDVQDRDLYSDLAFVLSKGNDEEAGNAALERVAVKLQLKTLSNIKQESRALNRLALGNGDDKKEMAAKMYLLLRRLKNLAMRDYALKEVIDCEKIGQIENFSSPIIPDEFRCPISLDLMQDPVIVATGQTYERANIQQRLDSGNQTCPKTQQVLPHLLLTPNYVLKSVITQWCETHGIEMPKKTPLLDEQAIEVLVWKLSCVQPEVQRAAAKELHILAKRSAENQVRIAESGALPLLVGLLSSQDQHIQEHAVTTILNLSIHESNKEAIVAAGGIGPIVGILKNGNMEARENAAAALCSLSIVDEYKVAIGVFGAVPALTSLLRDGTLRRKKSVACALLNLSKYHGNQVRAIRACLVPLLLQLLLDPSMEILDEALAILGVLASHKEGRAAIGQESAVPILIQLIKSGSPRNKEIAASVLLALCLNDPAKTYAVQQLGAHGPLTELVKNGTSRAQRKALLLLHLMKEKEKNTFAVI